MHITNFRNYLQFEKRFSTHTVHAYLADVETRVGSVALPFVNIYSAIRASYQLQANTISGTVKIFITKGDHFFFWCDQDALALDTEHIPDFCYSPTGKDFWF